MKRAFPLLLSVCSLLGLTSAPGHVLGDEPAAEAEPVKPAAEVWVALSVQDSGNQGEGSEYLGRIPSQVFAGLMAGTHHGLIPLQYCCYLGDDGELVYLDELDAAYSGTAYFPARSLLRLIPLRQPTIDRILNRKL